MMNGKEMVMLNKLKTGLNYFTNACKKNGQTFPDRVQMEILLSDKDKYIFETI